MSAEGGVIAARFAGTVGRFSLEVAFTVPTRGITALFGPSGCGKTTLLRCVAGLQRMAGRLAVGSEVWQDDAQGRFLRAHERPIGYVFQEASLFPHLSVRRNLEFGLARTAAAQRRVTFDEVVQLLGVTDLLDRRPVGLSGGQRQRVAIARALLTSPQLLLMDEPLASLDQASRLEILPYLERLHGELAMPVLYVSHAADEVARLADHFVLLEAGRVRAVGPLGEVRARLDLAADWGSEADTIIACRVAAHDEDFHLTYLDFAGGRISVARHDLPVGHAVRLRAAQLLVRLSVGGTPVLARITRKSASLLDLVPGKRVYAQVKSVALLG